MGAANLSPLSFSTTQTSSRIPSFNRRDSFSKKIILTKEGVSSDYSNQVFLPKQKSSESQSPPNRGEGGLGGEPGRAGVLQARALRAGGAGTLGRTSCTDLYIRLSSTERAAKLRCFGLKCLVGTGTLEGNTFKNSGHREGDESCCPRASMQK